MSKPIRERIRAMFTRQGDSLNDRIQKIEAALKVKFIQPGLNQWGGQKYRFDWPREVFDDYVISREDVTDKLFKIPYTTEGDVLTFGEPVEVEEEYVEVSGQPGAGGEAAVAQGADDGTPVERIIALGAAEFAGADDDKTFTKTRWILARFGPAAHKQILTKGAFEKSKAKWVGQGSKCYLNHPAEAEYYKLPERDLNHQLGYWSDHQVTAQGFEATLTIVPSFEKFRLDLKAAVGGGRKDFFQPSILGFAQGREVKQGGETWFEVQDFKTAFSVDMVNAGGAASEFKYAVQSDDAAITQGAEAKMNKKALAMLFKANGKGFQLVRQSLIAIQGTGVTAEMNEDQLAEKIGDQDALVTQAMKLLEATPPAGGETEEQIAARSQSTADAWRAYKEGSAVSGQGADTANPQSAIQHPQSEAEIPFNRMPKRFREAMVTQAYADSNLAEGLQQKIRERVAARLKANPGLDELDLVNDAIEHARDLAGIVEQSAGGRGAINNPTIVGGLNSLDRLRIAVNKAFGIDYDGFKKNVSVTEVMARQSGHALTTPDQSAWDSVAPIRSLARFYADMTGDEDLTCQPRFRRITRQAQTPWLTSDFAVLMQDAMHKRLLGGYREVDYGWERIATIKPLKDFRTQHVIKWGYIGDIPDVDTANAASYITATPPEDTEETYTPGTKGLLIELTRRDLLNDDLNAFSMNILRLGRSDARTLAKVIWLSCLFSNPVLAEDSKTLYHLDHNNLISDPLGTTGITNALIALMAHTEPGSGERMAFSPNGLTMVVPIQEYWNAIKLADLNNEPGGNADALAKEIRGMGIFVQLLPILTSERNWGLFCNKTDVEHVEVGFVQGNVEPEFFSMDGELHEKAFGQDIIMRQKLRHEYGAAPVDHRGSVLSIPL